MSAGAALRLATAPGGLPWWHERMGQMERTKFPMGTITYALVSVLPNYRYRQIIVTEIYIFLLIQPNTKAG